MCIKPVSSTACSQFHSCPSTTHVPTLYRGSGMVYVEADREQERASLQTTAKGLESG